MAKALADAEAAIERDPAWDKGHFRKAAALEAQDKFDEARFGLSASAQSAAVAACYTQRCAGCANKHGQILAVHVQALQHYSKAAELNPGNAEVAAKVRSLTRQLGQAPPQVHIV